MIKPPVTQTVGRKVLVEKMFDGIAPSYDFLNHFLSMGIDKSWRRKLIKKLAKEKPRRILDLATGTADLAIAAAGIGPVSITGIDISGEMLAIGRKKVESRALESLITLQQADSENIPFPESSFDAAMVAFGVRNYENLPKGLCEMNRVLRVNGKAFILEFSKPKYFPVKQIYFFYFRFILPLVGKMVSRHESAYSYLPESVNVFPQGNDFVKIMEEAGFRHIKAQKLTLGIATLYIGEKTGLLS